MSLKCNELCKASTNEDDAFWDADRWQGEWSSTDYDKTVLLGSEGLLRFKRCGGNFSDSAPFVDIWFPLKEQPELFENFKKLNEVPLRNRFIGLLDSYNCKAKGPSINVQKRGLKELLQVDLQTLKKPSLKRVCIEVLEGEPIDATFLQDVKEIREHPLGGLIQIGPDDCTNHSKTHKLSDLAPHFKNNVFNYVKIDGDAIADLTCSSSKAGFVDITKSVSYTHLTLPTKRIV